MDDLVKYRLEVANEKLVSARILMEAGQYKDSMTVKKYILVVGKERIQNE